MRSSDRRLERGGKRRVLDLSRVRYGDLRKKRLQAYLNEFAFRLIALHPHAVSSR